MDYIFKWLASKFLSRESQEHAGVILRDDPATIAATPVTNLGGLTKDDASFVKNLAIAPAPAPASTATPLMPASSNVIPHAIGFVATPKDADAPNPAKQGTFLYQQDAPSCSDCGSIMVRNGACYKCLNCGSTSGCS
jgi:ribonucleoside-diphosphate reductase alpha chain